MWVRWGSHIQFCGLVTQTYLFFLWKLFQCAGSGLLLRTTDWGVPHSESLLRFRKWPLPRRCQIWKGLTKKHLIMSRKLTSSSSSHMAPSILGRVHWHRQSYDIIRNFALLLVYAVYIFPIIIQMVQQRPGAVVVEFAVNCLASLFFPWRSRLVCSLEIRGRKEDSQKCLLLLLAMDKNEFFYLGMIWA